jgi:hypothetical protein
MRIILIGILFSPSYMYAQDSVSKEYKIGHNKIAVLKGSNDGLGKSTHLTKEDQTLLEGLIVKCISDNNLKEDAKSTRYLMKLEMYNRQYIPFTKDEQKFVLVNCFCDDVKHFPNWKKKIITVYDGGGCYFTVLINLTKGVYSELYINGIG